MKQLAGLFLLLVGVMFVAAWLGKPDNLNKVFSQKSIQQITQQPTPTPISTSKLPMKVGMYDITVELAQTPIDRQVGLSKHNSLDLNAGMLFGFGKMSVRTSMWMKGMSFPLDIIWIKDNKVSQITAEIPAIPAGTPDNKIPLYTPNQPIDYVLEVASGTAKQKGIKVGDSVILPTL